MSTVQDYMQKASDSFATFRSPSIHCVPRDLTAQKYKASTTTKFSSADCWCIDFPQNIDDLFCNRAILTCIMRQLGLIGVDGLIEPNNTRQRYRHSLMNDFAFIWETAIFKCLKSHSVAS
jgi:hypothetical protein